MRPTSTSFSVVPSLARSHSLPLSSPFFRVHYVHVPKSGGTAFGQVIRLLVCKMNEAKGAMDGSLDCCLNTVCLKHNFQRNLAPTSPSVSTTWGSTLILWPLLFRLFLPQDLLVRTEEGLRLKGPARLPGDPWMSAVRLPSHTPSAVHERQRQFSWLDHDSAKSCETFGVGVPVPRALA